MIKYLHRLGISLKEKLNGRRSTFSSRCLRFAGVMGTPVQMKEPIVHFGVLTDVQYADCNDKPSSHDPSITRFYRDSLNQVDFAFKHWEESSPKVKFVLQLGDIIDGLNRTHGGSYIGLRRTLAHFEKHSSIPTFHTVGNHELYNFNRKELASLFYESVMKLNIAPEIFCPQKPVIEDTSSTPVLYYKFSPAPGIKCISLDCFDVSVLGYDTDHPNYQKAANILSTKHGHSIFDDWDQNGTLEGLEIRFQQMNGALGDQQLNWLEQELKESDDKKEKVVVFGHVSLCPDNSDWSCLLWNYEEVVEIFHRHKCVVAYLSGHTHESGYSVDSHGISYIAFAGIVETPPNTSAFATVSIYPNLLEVKGHGLECSYSIPLQICNETSNQALNGELESSPATVKVKV